jgi:hypothetical protein
MNERKRRLIVRSKAKKHLTESLIRMVRIEEFTRSLWKHSFFVRASLSKMELCEKYSYGFGELLFSRAGNVAGSKRASVRLRHNNRIAWRPLEGLSKLFTHSIATLVLIDHKYH